ncbi:quinone oxidoreductase family protein [Microbaculum sp. FT89]|uniref:quinone oxidoreductase family protein n=1 Tax=Microbaculum sp. FT89 TaxID=3447298 RepID=UPI003F52CDB3
MRAIVIDSPGDIDQLVYRDIPDPAPGRGEVVIDVAYAAANWGDTQKRRGVYPDPISYPAVIGLEVSGRVVALGEGVEGPAVGQRVAAITGPTMLGGYAERCAVGAAYVIPLPDDMPLDIGASFPVVCLTAYHLLHSAYSVRAGECVLVHSISGAVGLALTQLGVAAGATVIGTVGSPGRDAPARDKGAALVIDRSAEDFVERALDFTEGRGVDLVIDSLGGDVLPRSFDCLKTYGHIINIGEAAGYPDFDIRPKLYERSTSLAGFEVLHAMRVPGRWQAGVDHVLAAIRKGTLSVPIARRFPFGEIRELHRAFETRTVNGKLLLEVAGEGV